jgi:tetratricopeptide (TPR) repeat protein
MIRVLEERSDELIASLETVDGLLKRPSESERGLEILCSHYCCNIGERYEEKKDYCGAVPWYHRGLFYAITNSQKISQTSGPFFDSCMRQLASMYCNLGLAQKHCGHLSLALENYNASLEIMNQDGVHKNRETLRREMKQWTGSSGTLTPGC